MFVRFAFHAPAGSRRRSDGALFVAALGFMLGAVFVSSPAQAQEVPSPASVEVVAAQPRTMGVNEATSGFISLAPAIAWSRRLANFNLDLWSPGDLNGDGLDDLVLIRGVAVRAIDPWNDEILWSLRARSARMRTAMNAVSASTSPTPRGRSISNLHVLKGGA